MNATKSIKNAASLITLGTVLLHLLGYLAEHYIIKETSLTIWLLITIINTAVALKCAQLIQTLYQKTYRDSLTGLQNRGFFDSLSRELDQVEHNSGPISVLMVDIDNFKEINDSLGHMAGDKVLREVSNIFRQCVRDQDVLIRWGGEEFVVILKQTSLDAARRIAETVRISVENHRFEPLMKNGGITISIGIASITVPAKLSEVIRLADEALYNAKRQGRNRVAVNDLAHSHKSCIS